MEFSLLRCSLSTLCVVLCVKGSVGAGAVSWSYTGAHDGVDKWSTVDSKCGGQSQSPIDLTSDKTSYDRTLAPFQLTNFDSVTDVTWAINNNGHTVGATYNRGDLRVSGGSLGGTYKVAQLHWHWGVSDSVGSEHLVDHKAYPLEVHIVTYNTKYPTLADAVSNADGLAVLGFFYEISSTDNPTMTKFTDVFTSVAYAGNVTASLPAFALADMLPDNTVDYYRYSGSLTTPGCNEVVTWTVFKNTINISAHQMEKFRALYDSHNERMERNYRDVQPINSRQIKSSFNDSLFGSSATSGASNTTWSYEGSSDGVTTWYKTYPTCGGTRQSPIDLTSSETTYDSSLTPFVFNNFNKASNVSWSIANTGHSVSVVYQAGNLTVSGGSLGGTYKVANIHWHWGGNDSTGSEHTINSQAYPLEVHIVTYNTKYGSLVEALTHTDGLAVLGFFYEITSNDNPTTEKVVSALESVKYAGNSSTAITPFPLQDLLPSNTTDYYRYDGSLTTPGCNEVVTWTVFYDTIGISSAQLAKFRELFDSHGLRMENNFRDAQPLNNRTIRVSFDESMTATSTTKPATLTTKLTTSTTNLATSTTNLATSTTNLATSTTNLATSTTNLTTSTTNLATSTTNLATSTTNLTTSTTNLATSTTKAANSATSVGFAAALLLTPIVAVLA